MIGGPLNRDDAARRTLLQERIGRKCRYRGPKSPRARRDRQAASKRLRGSREAQKRAEKHENKVPHDRTPLALEVWRAIKDDDWVSARTYCTGGRESCGNFDAPTHAGRELV